MRQPSHAPASDLQQSNSSDPSETDKGFTEVVLDHDSTGYEEPIAPSKEATKDGKPLQINKANMFDERAVYNVGRIRF